MCSHQSPYRCGYDCAVGNLHKSFPDPSRIMVWGFGFQKKKANAEKGPAKTTAAANATKDIRSDGQSKTPNIESRVFRKSSFHKYSGKAKYVLEKRFHALCKPSTNYITVGDFLFQFELNGIP